MKNTGKIHKSLRKIPLGGNNVRRKPIRGLLFVFFFFPLHSFCPASHTRCHSKHRELSEFGSEQGDFRWKNPH